MYISIVIESILNMETNSNRKVIIVLLILTLLLGVAAIAVGVYLSNADQAPEDSAAASCGTCDDGTKNTCCEGGSDYGTCMTSEQWTSGYFACNGGGGGGGGCTVSNISGDKTSFTLSGDCGGVTISTYSRSYSGTSHVFYPSCITDNSNGSQTGSETGHAGTYTAYSVGKCVQIDADGGGVGAGVCRCVPPAKPQDVSCNGSCSDNSECAGDLICSGGKCRNSSCTGQSDCVCNTTVSCFESCDSNNLCPDGLSCSNGKCVNTDCPAESDCVCNSVVSCNTSCDENNLCDDGLECIEGSCRNSECSEETDCVCNVDVSCNDTCDENNLCDDGLECIDGSCRNSECSEETDCTCNSVASCNNTCDENNLCDDGLTCIDGMCRNADCSADTDCVCDLPETAIIDEEHDWVIFGVGSVLVGLLLLKFNAIERGRKIFDYIRTSNFAYLFSGIDSKSQKYTQSKQKERFEDKIRNKS